MHLDVYLNLQVIKILTLCERGLWLSLKDITEKYKIQETEELSSNGDILF